jgi:predicted methyltransferase
MRRSLAFVLTGAVSAAILLSTGAMAPAPQDAAAYAAVLADPDRPEADRARDEARKTAQTLAFAEVEPGQTIGDMIIGGGYFTRVFASAVGEAGQVVAWQPAQFIAFQASYGESLTTVDEANENVSAIRSSIGEPEFPAGMDLIFTAQNYHDLHLQPFPADTAARVNAAVFAALKPGGLYVIIDHAALPGAGIGVAQTLHRIDIADVRREVEAAGFVLEAESDLLLNDTDPLTANVFDETIRGRTSQFMLRFRKPA